VARGQGGCVAEEEEEQGEGKEEKGEEEGEEEEEGEKEEREEEEGGQQEDWEEEQPARAELWRGGLREWGYTVGVHRGTGNVARVMSGEVGALQPSDDSSNDSSDESCNDSLFKFPTFAAHASFLLAS